MLRVKIKSLCFHQSSQTPVDLQVFRPWPTSSVPPFLSSQKVYSGAWRARSPTLEQKRFCLTTPEAAVHSPERPSFPSGAKVHELRSGLLVAMVGGAQSGENQTSRCWETPNELNLNQAPFVGIFAFKLSGTSFVAVMQWRKLRKRLVYGLSPENW